MRKPFAWVALVLGLALLSQSARPRFVYPTGMVAVLATRLPHPPRIGQLTVRGAWQLRGDSRGFGGFSGLIATGDTLTAVSDAGGLARFRVSGSPRWRTRLQRVGEACGPVLKTSLLGRDLESMTGSGATLWLASEWRNAICRIDAEGRRYVQPAAMDGWSRHFGPEAMARLPDGRFLVIAEGDGEGASAAVLFDRDPVLPGASATRLRYTPPPGFRTTDAAALPDGSVLLLHRRLTPFFTTRITRLPGLPDEGRPIVRGELLATIDGGRLRENYEGLAIDAGPSGVRLWLISDDNFAWYQSTKLLALALPPTKKGSAATALPLSKR